MKTMNAKTRVISFAIFLLMLLSVPAFASPIWISGEVTKAPYQANDTYYIQVDGETYRIRPGIRITQRFERRSGAYNEEKAYLSSIEKYREIMIRVEKYEVIQIILF